MAKIYFKQYDKVKHDPLLREWQNDKGARDNCVDNYTTFGLLDIYGDIIDLLGFYDPVQTDEEFLKTFIAFNQAGKDVGLVILDHVTFENKTTALNVFHIIVRPDEQGKGYGTAMMEKVVFAGEKMMGRRVDEVLASVDPDNMPSSHMMEKRGFKIIHKTGAFNIYSLDMKEKKKQISDEPGK